MPDELTFEERLERMEERQQRLELAMFGDEEKKEAGIVQDVKDIKNILTQSKGVVTFIKVLGWISGIAAALVTCWHFVKPK